MEKIYTSPVKNYIQRNGFVMVSSLLIDYQEELGLSESELMMIIKIMRHKDGFVIHDEYLDKSVSTRTLARRRSALKSKGYLNYTVVKKQDENGNFQTEGISYDLSPLEEKLQIISDKIEKEKEKEVKKVVKEEKLIAEKEVLDSPLEDYKNDYKKFYGVPYNISDYELKKYNELSNENKKIISYIFKYCQENGLLKKIVPRLSLFFKTPFRFVELRQYCIDNFYIETDNSFETSVENRKSSNNFDDLIKEIYYRYYDDIEENTAFYKAVDRIINKYNGNTDGIEKILDKSYEDTYNLKRS